MELKDIKFDQHNFRKHNSKNQKLIKKSIKETGFGRSVVIDSENELIAGNGVVSQLPKDTKIKVIETDGSELVVVKRIDLKTNDRKRQQLALNDNATADKVEWNNDELIANFSVEDLKEWDIKVPNVENDLEDLSDEFEHSFEVVVECINEEEQQMAYDKLIAEGYKCRILTL